MDFVMDVLRTIVMVGFVAVVILALGALFMVVFGLATSMDRRMSE